MVTKDINGITVHEGDRVRILAIPKSVLESLSPEEREKVTSMVGMVLAVYEVDDYRHAWVEAKWDIGPGQVETHSLGLEPCEMEVVYNG